MLARSTPFRLFYGAFYIVIVVIKEQTVYCRGGRYLRPFWALLGPFWALLGPFGSLLGFFVINGLLVAFRFFLWPLLARFIGGIWIPTSKEPSR